MWDSKPLKIELKNKAMIGKAVKTFFKITEKAIYVLNVLKLMVN